MLFNGAMVRDPPSCSIFDHDDATASLLQNAIAPLAKALQGYESLAMWEVINEPEGILAGVGGSDGPPCDPLCNHWTCKDPACSGCGEKFNCEAPKVVPSVESRCTDTSRLGPCSGDADGPGWNGGCKFSIGTLQRFVNRVSAVCANTRPTHTPQPRRPAPLPSPQTLSRP